MIYFSQFILLALAVLIAKVQAKLIEEGEHIYHALWAAGWAALTFGCVYLLQHELTWLEAGLYCAATGCGHLVLFNICLNRFRGLKWDYSSVSTGSILDQLELRLFGQRVWILEGILTIVWIGIQIYFVTYS